MVLAVECLGARASVFVQFVHATGRRGSEILLAPEQLGGATLSRVPIDGGGLVCEVEDEPQLDARVGHHDVHTVLVRESECLGHVWMDVAVEHAPDCVVSAAPPATELSLGVVFSGDGSLNESERRSTSSVNSDEHVVSEVAPQWQ